MSLRDEIDEAIHAHAAWVVRFRDFLNGRVALDVPHIGDTDCCRLGHWLDQEGRRLLPQADHADIHALHAAFHRTAAELVQKIKHQDMPGARADLAPEGAFNVASLVLRERLLRASLHAAPPAAAKTEPADTVPHTPHAAATQP